MQKFNRSYAGNQSLSPRDFQWGKEDRGIQIGLWSSQTSIEVGKQIQLRAAVRNLSNSQVKLGNHFELVIKSEKEVFEHPGGPRSSTPISLKPGEFKEILGWCLGEQTGISTGICTCRVIYRPNSGTEIKSEVVKVEIKLDLY